MTEREKDSQELTDALNQLARALAVRDHSRLELREKLGKKFGEDLVEDALRIADTKCWLGSEEEIAARAALTFQRKLKSRAYIENQLQKRGLPLPPFDRESETMTARKLVEKNFGPVENLEFEAREEVLRYLSYRGFDEHTIRTVLNAE